jgi:hypothetical protein
MSCTSWASSVFFFNFFFNSIGQPSSTSITSLHHLPSTSRHLFKRSFTSHQSKSSAHLHRVFSSSHTIHRHFSQRSISFDSFTSTARLFLHATDQDALSLRILCQFPNSELFSFSLTFLLMETAILVSTQLFSLPLAHFYTSSSSLLHFTSSHKLHTTISLDNKFSSNIFFDIKFLSNQFFDIKIDSKHLFDIKIISKHFFISATTIFPLQRQLSIIKTSQQPSSSSSSFRFSFHQALFSTKHEVSALSGYVLNIHHFSKPSLTLKGIRFRFSGESRAFSTHQHLNISTFFNSTAQEGMPSSPSSTSSLLVSTVTKNTNNKFQP